MDTNVWVSAFLNPLGHPAQLVQHWIDGSFCAVTATASLDELARVLARPRLQHIRRYSRAEAHLYVAAIRMRATLVPTTGMVRACRDPDDDALLEAALAGKAKFVVSRDADLTRDPDLLRVFAARGIRIVTVRQFLRHLKGQE